MGQLILDVMMQLDPCKMNLDNQYHLIPSLHELGVGVEDAIEIRAAFETVSISRYFACRADQTHQLRQEKGLLRCYQHGLSLHPMMNVEHKSYQVQEGVPCSSHVIKQQEFYKSCH